MGHAQDKTDEVQWIREAFTNAHYFLSIHPQSDGDTACLMVTLHSQKACNLI